MKIHFFGGTDMTCPAYDLPKQTLLSTISSLYERRSLFFSNPDSDFTRVKKISFDQTILFPIIAGKENTATELIDFFNEGKIPFPSAMIQLLLRCFGSLSEGFRSQKHSVGISLPVSTALAPTFPIILPIKILIFRPSRTARASTRCTSTAFMTL